MKTYKYQRWALYSFFVSINFEIYDPFNSGIFSVAKAAGLLYCTSLLPTIKYFLRTNQLKNFLRPITAFFLLILAINIWNINYLSTTFIDTTLLQNIILFWLLINHESKDPGILERGLLYFAFGSVIVAFLYYLGIGVEYEDNRVSIFGDNENAVGIRMSISTIVILLTLLQNKFNLSKWRYLFLIPLPFMLSLMAETGSRVAFFSLSLSFFIGCLLFKSKNFFFKIRVVLITSFIGFYVWDFLMQTEVLKNRLDKSVENGDLGGRDAIWMKLLPLIENNLILGVGQTGYELYTFQKFGQALVSPHNVIIEVLVYTGLLGLIFYSTFLGRLVFQSWRYYLMTGYLLSLILFIPIAGLIISGQLLGTKIGYIIFAFAGSRIFYTNSFITPQYKLNEDSLRYR